MPLLALIAFLVTFSTYCSCLTNDMLFHTVSLLLGRTTLSYHYALDFDPLAHNSFAVRGATSATMSCHQAVVCLRYLVDETCLVQGIVGLHIFIGTYYIFSGLLILRYYVYWTTLSVLSFFLRVLKTHTLSSSLYLFLEDLIV